MEHEIIYDLLPLYHDGVCSEASRRAVEEHLQGCEACRKALADMDAPLPEAEKTAADDAAAVQKISREWRGSKRRAWLKGAAIAVLVCALILGGWHLLTGVYCVPVDTDGIEITALSRLEDGRVMFHLRVTDDKDLRRVSYEYDGAGNLHVVPLRPVLTVSRRADKGLWDSDYTTDLAEHNVWNVKYGDGKEATKIYLGRGEDAILLWEEGMELPAASAVDEAHWGYEPGSAEYWALREEN